MNKRKFLTILTSSSVGLGLVALLPKSFTKGLENTNSINTKNIKENKIQINLNPLAVKRNNKGLL